MCPWAHARPDRKPHSQPLARLLISACKILNRDSDPHSSINFIWAHAGIHSYRINISQTPLALSHTTCTAAWVCIIVIIIMICMLIVSLLTSLLCTFLEHHGHWTGINLHSLSKCSSHWLCRRSFVQPYCLLGHGIFLNLHEATCSCLKWVFMWMIINGGIQRMKLMSMNWYAWAERKW